MGDEKMSSPMMAALKPNAQRTRTATILIYICLGVSVFLLAATLHQYIMLRQYENGMQISAQRAQLNDKVLEILSATELLTLIVSGVCFMRWFRRAYYNLGLLTGNLQFRDYWTVWAWIIPVISLFRPYQMVKELYTETEGLLTGKNLISHRLDTNWLGWWWGLWICSNILGQILYRGYWDDSIGDLETSTLIRFFGAILDIPLSLLAVKLIRDYARVTPQLTEDPMPAASDSVFSEAEQRYYLDRDQ